MYRTAMACCPPDLGEGALDGCFAEYPRSGTASSHPERRSDASAVDPEGRPGSRQRAEVGQKSTRLRGPHQNQTTAKKVRVGFSQFNSVPHSTHPVSTVSPKPVHCSRIALIGPAFCRFRSQVDDMQTRERI